MLLFSFIIALPILTVVQSDDLLKVDIIQITARNARDSSIAPTHFYYKH